MAKRTEKLGAAAPTLRPDCKSPFFYEQNTQDVQDRLREFGFGQTVDFLTPEGINKDAYIPYARAQLFGEDYQDITKGLPDHVGEVALAGKLAILQKRMPKAVLKVFSMNVGYGHLRPAEIIANTARILGAKAESIFMGGPQDFFPHTPWLGIDPNKVLRATARKWEQQSYQKAYEQGMIESVPEVRYESRIHPLLVDGMMLLRDPKELVKDLQREGLKNARRVIKRKIAEGISVKDNATADGLTKQGAALEKTFGGMMRYFFNRTHNDHPDNDVLVVSTHPLLARLIGQFQPNAQQLKRKTNLDFIGAHFGPDVDQPLDAWVGTQTNFVERPESSIKWGMRLGLPNHQMAPNTVVMEGYAAPVPVFLRTSLTNARKEALENGMPLTVIATASGVAQAQLEPFKRFIYQTQNKLREGKLRLVVQCGAEDGQGHKVYNELQQFLSQHNLTDSPQVALHVAKTPQAAVDFFEAVSWAPVPMALLVKGAEVARIAHALNIPVIPTGIVGDHEALNFIATLQNDPQMLSFSQDVGPLFQKECGRILQNHLLSTYYQRENPQALDHLQDVIRQRTAPDTETLLRQVQEYILSGTMSHSDPAAMLMMFEEMFAQQDRQKILSQEKKSSQHKSSFLRRMLRK